MSYRKTLLTLTVSGLLAATGAASADDCDDRLDAFEERLEAADLSEDREEQLEEYLESAWELEDEDHAVVCQEMVANMNAMLSEYSSSELPTTARAEIADGNDWDLEDDAEELEEDIESGVEAAGAAVVTAAAITAEELDDADVVNLNGEEIGEFEDFVRHTASGETHAVLEIDEGWFSEREVVVPASDLEMNADGELVYSGAIALEEAVEFDEEGYELIDADRQVSQLRR